MQTHSFSRDLDGLGFKSRDIDSLDYSVQSDVFRELLGKGYKVVTCLIFLTLKFVVTMVQISRSEAFHFSDPLNSLQEVRFNPCELRFNPHELRFNPCKLRFDPYNVKLN